MSHFVEDLRQEAEAAIARMTQAALAARMIHARAELMRHMLATARKLAHRPRPEAVETVVREWMGAWSLDRGQWPHIAREMEAFTAAFHDYANAPTDAHDIALREACAALDAALTRENSSLADQMAWRSECAHRWWQLVVPRPADLPGGTPRPAMPELAPEQPFWESGCAPFCR